MSLDTFRLQAGQDFERESLSVLFRHLRNYHDSAAEDLEPGRRLRDSWELAESRHNHLRLADDGTVVGGLFVEDGQVFAWGLDRDDPTRPVALRLVVDGAVLFERTSAPLTDQPVYATGYRLAPNRALEFSVDGRSVSATGFAGHVMWPDMETRDELAGFIANIGPIARDERLRHLIWQDIPKLAQRLETSDEPAGRWRASVFTRYLANRLGLQAKLSGAQSVANWIVSDLFEDHYKRQIFCLTDEIRALLSEPALNRRVMKHEISLTLFAFWRRHYQHIDIFSEEGLRLVQYKFVTAPFVADKNNILLVAEGVRRALSNPADMYRNRELPWSWYWLFMLEDQGLGERMRDERFAKLTSFREVVLDITQPERLSFNPHTWRAYWGAGGTPDFTRFDLALISILGNIAVPELAIAEHGAEYWRERLLRHVYEQVPELAVLSAIGRIDVAALPALDIPRRDLVIIGHPNETGVGRNLGMFMDATSRFNPLVFSADDGSCLNPDASYNPAVGVRARVVLLCVNADRAPEVLARFAGLCEDARIIGFYLWESDRPPASHGLGAVAVDEIWAPTNYVADAYRKVTSVRVEVVKKGIHLPMPHTPFLDRFRNDPSEFIFLCAAEFGSSIVRKNPLDVVKAFQRAFEDSDANVRLIIKIREVNPSHWSNIDSYWEEIEERIAGDSRISIIEGNLTPEEYWTLISTIDAMVSLHRSEGFGYVIADAMLAGKPAVVSDYSGSQDFCDATNAYPVPVQQTPAPPESLASRGYIGQWGVPDVEAAAQAMRDVVENAEERREKAERGRERIARDYDFDTWRTAIAARIQLHLDAVASTPASVPAHATSAQADAQSYETAPLNGSHH